LGYLERGNLTAKADMLANVYDTNGLVICEAIDRGWLDGLEPDDVAEVCSWFSFDRDSKFGNHFLLPDGLLRLRRELEELQYEVFVQERRADLAISTGYNRLFFGAMRAWCRGAELGEIGELVELSEGDLVSTFNKTLDLMRQLRDMLLDADQERPLRHALDWAIKLAQRDIVAQSYGVGFLLPDADATHDDEPEPPEPDEPPPVAPLDAISPTAPRRARRTAGAAARPRRQPRGDRPR
jgi:ATP-dependent RNA helicase HelY